MQSEFWTEWLRYFTGIIAPSIASTLRMLSISMLLGTILGFLLAIMLILWGEKGLNPKKIRYSILDFLINSLRSFPIIILIVAISPITRMVMGTSIGERAAIFPLTIAATPFLARIIENSLLGVNSQLIEAARSFGAGNLQIIFRIMLKEATPSIISGITLAAIVFLTATTMAGAVGAGGIGAVALNHGFQSFNNSVLYTSVIVLLIMVYTIQLIGHYIFIKTSSKG